MRFPGTQGPMPPDGPQIVVVMLFETLRLVNPPPTGVKLAPPSPRTSVVTHASAQRRQGEISRAAPGLRVLR